MSGDCWTWQAKTERAGYGLFRDSPTSWALAHRYSYELHHGPIPEGLIVLHSCDNPSCVNPAHLSLGTHQDNSDDMVSKGRHRQGHKELDAKQAELVRWYLELGLSQDVVATLMGVSQGTISKIKRGAY